MSNLRLGEDMPAEEETEQPEYVGHRQRLKARFEQTGFQGFQDYSDAVAFPRKVVEGALRYRAATVIVGHNHPGDCRNRPITTTLSRERSEER